jgi:hypothetical protein
MTQETNMQRSHAILLAAATVLGTSAASLPAQAAARAPEVTSTGVQIEQIRDRERWGGDRERWGGDWDRGHDGDNWRHRRHHRHHRDYDNGFSGFSFNFGFPQAYYQPYPRYYQPYRGYSDCFRTWDGQLICR